MKDIVYKKIGEHVLDADMAIHVIEDREANDEPGVDGSLIRTSAHLTFKGRVIGFMPQSTNAGEIEKFLRNE